MRSATSSRRVPSRFSAQRRKSLSTRTQFSLVNFPDLGGSNAEAAEEQARTRGHAAGYAAGLRAAEVALDRERRAEAAERAAIAALAQERNESHIALLRAAIAAVNARTAPVLDEAHQLIATGAIDLAESIIGIELSDAPRSARAAVTRALRDVDPTTILVLRMHPSTLAALEDDCIVDGITYSADASVAPGDAIADFAEGYLDARISSAISRARIALIEGPAY
ncbi:hypothetical protein DF220_08275 [Salinibacterium hongtaonis]|uniref:Flagellar assembly protein FliH/Type III secretion system HrpE domain-containing protein n=1 Tax=Homoserinimonas hongtaonis TaxID=2079791 RepID=A0A2U1T1T7_9MICO|nr:hypothetical protein DF220_08275 [Salinibacterium hongtaonis]